MVKIIVSTPSRLHFTLIDLNGEIGRVDGGIGVALERLRTKIEVTANGKSPIRGRHRHLVEAFQKRFLNRYGLKGGASINILSHIPQHVGLGSNTQLSLAVGRALAELYDVKVGVRELAEVMGRGGTSGIGVAAFAGGGFILDGGHSFGGRGVKQHFTPSRFSKSPPASLLVRYSLPRNWFFVVAVPKVRRQIHGAAEAKIFATRCPIPSTQVEKLSRLILLKVLPSVVERDVASLGSALTEIQRVGFKRIEVELQHPVVKLLMKHMLSNGAYGVGMSSFGPVVYGLTNSKKTAEAIGNSAKNLLAAETGGDVFYSRVDNHGATLKVAN
jgi:beta-ribofuranosylaminobenzene 5'-phosphate synthase